MKITIEPDSSDVEFIRSNWQALDLIKSFLQALGISEADRERWDDVLWAEVDTSSTIKFEGMTCYLPDTIKNEQSWKYSTLFHNSFYLLLLNGLPFLAKMTNINAVDDLPSDLINFSCQSWPYPDLSQSFNKLSQLKSLNLSYSILELSWTADELTDITPLKNLTELSSLDLSGCSSLSDITPIKNLKKVTQLNLSGCSSLLDITPIKNFEKVTKLNLSGCRSLLDITPIKNFEKFTHTMNSLVLNSCSSLSDITPIKNFAQLTSLNLSGCSSLSDITPIKNLAQLTLLNLSGCESLTDITSLEKLIQLNSLNLSGNYYSSKFLTDITPLENLTHLISLDVSNCESLTDITPLEKLTQLNSLELSSCKSLSDITPLEKLTQLNSLGLSSCTFLSDINPIAKLKQLVTINLNYCTSISNISAIQFLQTINSIDISGCLRLRKFPDFKQLKHLRNLDATLHPTVVPDILAHCAVSREDWAFINQNADAWTSELESALKASHPAAYDLATSLAIAFPRISIKHSERLSQILQTDVLLDYRPWKHLFLGLFQQMGFNALPNLANTIAAGSWPRGAIGGLSAIAEQLITLADGKELFAGWVRAISAHHESNPSFLKPVAAPWCLALHCLGENELLDQWIARFTDPDDSSALDAVFLEFGNHRLGHNDAPGAFRHAMRIRATLVRDGLLADIASHYLEAQQADPAAELLFLLSAEDKRAELSLKLADIPHFLDNRDNLHRLLAACGKDAPAIGKLLAKAGMASDFNPADRASICSTAAREATRVGAMIAGTDVRNTENLRQLMEDHFMNIFQAKSDNSSGL